MIRSCARSIRRSGISTRNEKAKARTQFIFNGPKVAGTFSRWVRIGTGKYGSRTKVECEAGRLVPGLLAHRSHSNTGCSTRPYECSTGGNPWSSTNASALFYVVPWYPRCNVLSLSGSIPQHHPKKGFPLEKTLKKSNQSSSRCRLCQEASVGKCI